jgi:HPt (histidine-containing phosphotransfer) domain-containing protein
MIRRTVATDDPAPRSEPARPLAGLCVMLDLEDRAIGEQVRGWVEAAGAQVLIRGVVGLQDCAAPPLVICDEPGAAELFVLCEGQLRLRVARPPQQAELVRALAGLAVAPAAVARGAPPIDAAKLAEWVGGDPAALREIVVEFLKINGPFLGDLGAAVASGDPAATRMLAHRLKGSAGMVGARALAQASLALEVSARGDGRDFAALFEAVTREYRALESHLRAEYRITAAEAP